MEPSPPPPPHFKNAEDALKQLLEAGELD